MSRTVRIKLYYYLDLTEEAKIKALEHFADINVDYNWWEFIYKDCEEIGCEIKSFDLDKRDCKIEFNNSCNEVSALIILNHGEECNTYKLAKDFVTDWNNLVLKYSDSINTDKVSEDNIDIFDIEADELENVFKKAISEDYLSILRKEYEYRISREAIEETIVCNCYEFTSNGNFFSHP